MAAMNGSVEVCTEPAVPRANRTIAFHGTSNYTSCQAMEPLSELIARTGEGANAVGGGAHHQHQQQQSYQNQQMSGTGGGMVGKSEPLSSPFSMPLQWTAPEKIGAGLSNLGNTCFLNSVLQCLTYTPPLAGYLQSGHHKVSCRVAGFCAFCALEEHVQQALASSGKVVSPQKLAKNLRSICRSFRMGRQEDSHEYMRYLLEALHKCCLPPDLAKNSNSKSSQEKSLVYRIFGGQLRSQVKCTVCSYCSNTYDPFLDLSLEIVRADSLTKALSRFTAVDVLDGDNMYRCLQCKKKVCAMKKFTIDSVPNILTIQFKRFSSMGGPGGKIDKKVEFGTALDLKPFVSNGQDNIPKYKLFGVLVHAGWSTHSGHYYSFLRASSDIWHVFDDSRVRQVSEKTVLEQKAYMLFYVREGKRANNSHAEPAPTKQALPQQLAVLSKGRQSNPEAGVTSRQELLPPVSVLHKERERKSLPEAFPLQLSSDPVSVVSKDRGGNGPSEVLPRLAALKSDRVCVEGNGHSTLRSNGASRQISAKGGTSMVKGGDHHISNTIPPFLGPSYLDEPAVGLCPTVGEHYVPTKEKYRSKEVEISCCTTSGNSGCENDWDEYYESDRNPRGSMSQNFVKKLQAVPHIQKYYQARDPSAKVASKVVGNINGELEIEHRELPKTSTVDMYKDVKRPHSFNESVCGAKRQQRECGFNRISNTCMASEEFSMVEPMEIRPSNGSRLAVQENGLQVRVERAQRNGLLRDVSAGNKSGDELKVVERLLVKPERMLENERAGSDGHIHATCDHSKESLNDREIQHSGAQLNVQRHVENNCQILNRCLGSQQKTYSSSSRSDTAAETSNGAGIPVSFSDEARGNESSVKDVSRLLEADNGNSKQDNGNLEYDTGGSYRVQNKTSREARDNEMSSNVRQNVTYMSVNGFRNFGTGKKTGIGVKLANRIGFKAGYGYGLKTG